MRWSVGDILMFILMSILTILAIFWVLFNIGLYIGVSHAQRVHGADEVHDVSSGVVQEVNSHGDSCAGEKYCHLSVEDYREGEEQADRVQNP